MTLTYQWVMFYTCLYMFAMWDAYRDVGSGLEPFSYIPFVLSSFVGTVGVIYSPIFHVNGIYFGGIWLPILFHIIGFVIGKILRKHFIIKYLVTSNDGS